MIFPEAIILNRHNEEYNRNQFLSENTYQVVKQCEHDANTNSKLVLEILHPVSGDKGKLQEFGDMEYYTFTINNNKIKLTLSELEVFHVLIKMLDLSNPLLPTQDFNLAGYTLKDLLEK